jgi:galactonate dehydratase
MKITRLEIVHVRPRYSFLKVHTDTGIVGLGEACLEGRARVVEAAVMDFADILVGQDPRQIERLWNLMFRSSFYPAGSILASAISAVDQALWDILGKHYDAPVHALLGGAVRDRLRVYKHVNLGDWEVTAQDETQLAALAGLARTAVDEGYTMIKTALPGPVRVLESKAYIDSVVARMTRLRDTIGDDVDFAIDFHGRVNPSLALQLIREIDHLKPLFIEEPCLPENVDAMARIVAASPLPIATGERLFTRWGFRELLEKAGVAIVQPDISHCGGISEARKIATMAETYYAGFAPHNPLGPVNLAASLHLSATIPGFLAQEQLTYGVGLLKRPFEQVDGYVDLPAGPGLGIELDEEAFADDVYDGGWRIPTWHHPADNALAPW